MHRKLCLMNPEVEKVELFSDVRKVQKYWKFCGINSKHTRTNKKVEEAIEDKRARGSKIFLELAHLYLIRVLLN